METILYYDGSFDGLLTAVFVCYEERINTASIQKSGVNTFSLFAKTIDIISDQGKAKRVWKAIENKANLKTQQQIFKTFLSELKGMENTLLRVIQYILTEGQNSSKNYSHPDVLRIHQIAKMVGREEHRIEAFVRFQRTKDDLYVASVSPDFNVLPLIIYHFKDRYADQQWLIYDLKRSYGIHYDLKNVKMVSLDFLSEQHPTVHSKKLHNQEKNFQKLWAAYYQSVNIKSRKNSVLHLQHIPKRYWKYLTEKIVQ